MRGLSPFFRFLLALVSIGLVRADNSTYSFDGPESDVERQLSPSAYPISHKIVCTLTNYPGATATIFITVESSTSGNTEVSVCSSSGGVGDRIYVLGGEMINTITIPGVSSGTYSGIQIGYSCLHRPLLLLRLRLLRLRSMGFVRLAKTRRFCSEEMDFLGSDKVIHPQVCDEDGGGILSPSRTKLCLCWMDYGLWPWSASRREETTSFLFSFFFFLIPIRKD